MLAGDASLRLLLNWDGQRIVAARIAAARPLAARILLGQAAEQAVALVPRLFSLCGQAQGVAAQLALLAARGESAESEVLDQAVRRVALEALGEHLWRLLLDWPPLLGQEARKDEFLSWRKRLIRVKDASSAAQLGVDLTQWLDRETPLSVHMDLSATSMQGALLPWLTAEEWTRQPIDEIFAHQPHFASQPAETGALARQFENAEVAALHRAGCGIAARLAARYADLRDLANGLIEPSLLAGWVDAAPVGEGCGLARVETSRGVLLHLIQVKAATVQRYVIVAPTEWNFHPDGPVVREITGSPATSRAQVETRARCLALALDPCVACEVDIHAL